MTHTGNETGGGSSAGIIHAAGVFWEDEEAAGDIIHAAGVRFGFPSSAPKRAGCERLPGWRDPFELVAEILEVVRVDAQAKHFLDHR